MYTIIFFLQTVLIKMSTANKNLAIFSPKLFGFHARERERERERERVLIPIKEVRLDS